MTMEWKNLYELKVLVVRLLVTVEKDTYRHESLHDLMPFSQQSAPVVLQFALGKGKFER